MKKSISPVLRLFTGMTLLVVILIITSSCKKTSDTPGPNEVFIQGMAFNPSTITVASGTTITWTNKDGVAHTVTSNTGLFDSGSVSSGLTYSHTFSSVGTFPYHCSIHTSMTASVVVN